MKRLLRMLMAMSLVVVACGDDDSGPPYGVVSEVISHETTSEILVWQPDVSGEWPLIYALHGIGGVGEDMGEIALDLAEEGYIVFAPTYRTEADLECGYRYVRSIAADHGGDLDAPLTFLGYSAGASAVLEGGLNASAYGPDGTYDECFTGAPRADVIVAVAGCHYEFEGNPVPFDVTRASNPDAKLVFLGGDEDSICPLWQSQDAVDEFVAAGYDATLVELEGANHYAPIFHDNIDGEWVVIDHPAGHQVVETALDAISQS